MSKMPEAIESKEVGSWEKIGRWFSQVSGKGKEDSKSIYED